MIAILKFIAASFIFFCGCGTGVCIMCLLQISKESEYKCKSFEEKYNDLIYEEIKETFKYDCLDDQEGE